MVSLTAIYLGLVVDKAINLRQTPPGDCVWLPAQLAVFHSVKYSWHQVTGGVRADKPSQCTWSSSWEQQAAPPGSSKEWGTQKD